MEPASTIIPLLGGVSAVARLTGVHRTRVSNWQRARSRGGTDGRIPQSHHAVILSAARERGIAEITADLLISGDHVVAPHPASIVADAGAESGPDGV